MNIIFMGTPDFAVPVLQRLIDDGYQIKAVVTQPDRKKGRKKVLTPPPVKKLATYYNIPVLQPEKVREPSAVQEILNYQPDLLVTAAYGQILPVTLLNGPKLGCINVHASLLPKYRGGAPIHQAIIDGEKETGVTIMYMVKALDAGDMLAKVRIPIEDHDTMGTLHDKLSAAGARLLSETIPLLESGQITPVAQDPNQVTFAPTIQHENEKIDWSKNGKEIHNLVRGLNPFPGAYTLLDGKVFKIWKTQKLDTKKEAEPGTVIECDKEAFTVATGSHEAIRVLECQPSGKKKMITSQFLNGKSLDLGTRLGD
ncbi:methionyl-tRNA formyltransferase [Terrilactibacillus laevilacticus]|uniref:Methionyl-tRNA formyltransferase n=1 Tax=Terrilactibacillus laevilacticus TaxID=1380157 RepID=A0ABW5PQ18_9BACI|nr:methionyl-tRNA formyltransferase [Terrilactibacillus laevilacticus]